MILEGTLKRERKQMIEILTFTLYDTCYRLISMGLGSRFWIGLARSKARDVRNYMWFRYDI